MDNFDILKLDNQLCFSAYAFSRAIIKAYRPFLDELNITYPQYLVMLVLWEHKNITLKDIGHKLHLDSGTLTPLLKKLEAAGFIVRERSKEDERLLWVSITPKGMELREKAIKVPENILKATNADLQELHDLKVRLDKIFKNLDSDSVCE